MFLVKVVWLPDYGLNNLLCPMGSMVFTCRNPRAHALAALGTLQHRTLGFLNTVYPLDTVSI